MPFVVAFGIALLLMPAAWLAGTRLGLVDRPTDELKIHGKPVPILGGVAVAVTALVALALLGRSAGPAVVVAVAVALAVGLIDDRRPLPAWARALAHGASGLALVAGGLGMELLGPLGGVGMVALTMACANAVNILDGQDGLAGGVGAIAALGLAALTGLSGDPEGTRLGLVLAGSLLGFLAWNLSPVRIFLGNGGAYAVGTLLAVLAARVVNAAGWRGLVAAGICLGVLIFELGFTVGRRLLAGDRLAGGDRLHSYDLLAGVRSRPVVTVVFWILAGGAAGLALVVNELPVGAAWAVAGGAAAAAAAGGVALWSRLATPLRRVS